jgi:hypothetical protein
MRTFVVLVALSASAILAARLHPGGTASAAPDMPKVWDETALADWATPVAGLNVRPTNMAVRDYYWYRGHYLHDGSVATLEEMFDPNRVKATHRPAGSMLQDSPPRAISGHIFGLQLKPAEREQLIAFLRTL